MDSRAVQGVGLGRRDRALRRALPDAEGTRARADRADEVHGEARGTGRGGRSDLGSEERAASRPTTPTRSTATSPAPLVYVNYGRPEDYEELDRLGISVKGAIVIARYGESWRGIKPKVAAEHGAVGCLIYSDPRDDGYCEGDVFPNGPMRPRDGVQRGSVMDMPVYPGDPLTPGVGATPDAKRLARQAKRRRSRRFPCCRFPTPTRSRCWRR